MSESAGNVLGIDLGACYAKAVFLRPGDETFYPVRNTDGACAFRVCATRDAAGAIQPLTQDRQRRRALAAGQPTLENVKPLRGASPVGGEVEAAILRAVLDGYRAEANDPALANLARVVFTHPVSHRPAAVAALLRIAAQVGLPADKLDTVEEPVALGWFCKRQRPEFDGRLFVIDTGHYTTDFVLLDFGGGAPRVRGSQYLSCRLGVAELIHALARSAWVKGQMAGGADVPVPYPFNDFGPEAGQPLVRALSAWAEADLVRSIELGLFGPEASACLDLRSVPGCEGEPWVANLPGGTLPYFYDESSSRQGEDLERCFPAHDRQLGPALRRESYAEIARSVGRALSAAAFAALAGAGRGSDLEAVVGGGLSLVAEVRRELDHCVTAHRIPAPHDLNYPYPGLSGRAGGMERLLAVAAGAAVAGTQAGARREDTLADTIGVLAWYDAGEALALLDDAGQLVDGFAPTSASLSELGARTYPGSGQCLAPLNVLLARRGAVLPATFTFPDALSTSEAGGTVYLTRYGDQESDLAAAGQRAGTGEGALARLRLPPARSPDEALTLTLEVQKNDVWRLRVVGSDGQTVIEQDSGLELLPRSG